MSERLTPSNEIGTRISEKDREAFLVIINGRRRQYRIGEILLGLVYFSSTIISVVSSALAGLVLQLNWYKNYPEFQKDLASGLAFLATILITVTISVGLNKQWQANRSARVQIDSLKLDLMKTEVNKDMIIEELKKIDETRNPPLNGQSPA